MDTIHCNDWNEFLDLTCSLARSYLPFEYFNWSSSDKESRMDMSSVSTQATFNCSDLTDDRDELQLMRRQRMSMNKHRHLINFLEGLDSDWEVTAEYEWQDYIEETSRNSGQTMHRSEAIDENVLSSIAMVPTDIEDTQVLQAKKHANLLFTRCCRTLEYLEAIESEEWEIRTPADLNSNESPLALQLELSCDDDMCHSASKCCVGVAVHKSIQEHSDSVKNISFLRCLDTEFRRISEVKEEDDLIILSSSLEDENEEATTNKEEPPACIRISQGLDNEFASISSENDVIIPSLRSSNSELEKDTTPRTSGGNVSNPKEPQPENPVDGSDVQCRDKYLETRFQLLVLDCTVVPKQIAEVAIPSEESRCSVSASVYTTRTQDCSVPVACADFNRTHKVSVTDQNSPTGVVVLSPDDPLGFQHLTWQESTSPDSTLTPVVSPVELPQSNDLGTASTVSEFPLQLPSNRKYTHPTPHASPKKTPRTLDKDESFEETTVDCAVVPETIPEVAIATQESKCTVSPFVYDQKNRTRDCGVQIACGAFDGATKVSVTDPKSLTEVELSPSPDDPFGLQHSTWQESKSLSVTTVTPVVKPVKPRRSKPNGEAAVTKRKSALKPATPTTKRVRYCRSLKRKLIAATSPNLPKKVQFNLTPKVMNQDARLNGSPLSYRTNWSKKNNTPVSANAKYDPYDVSHIDDDGDTTFENLFTRRRTTPEALNKKTSKRNKKKRKEKAAEPQVSPVSESSMDSMRFNILSILQETEQSFNDAMNVNHKKIETNHTATSETVNISEERLTEIIRTVITDVMKSTRKPRRRRVFRRSAPPRKMVLKKLFVPKRKPCEDKAVQVFITEDKSTNTLHSPLKNWKLSEDKEVQVLFINDEKSTTINQSLLNVDSDARTSQYNNKNIEKPKRQSRTYTKKDVAERIATKASQSMPVKRNDTKLEENQAIVQQSNRKNSRKSKKCITVPVCVSSSTVNKQPIIDKNLNSDNNGYKQMTMPQYLQRKTKAAVQENEHQFVQNLLSNVASSKQNSTKGCYRSPQQFNTQASDASNSLSSTLKPSTIYCPNATIVFTSVDQENSFFQRIDELRLSGMQSASSQSEVIPSSQPFNERMRLYRRQSYPKVKTISIAVSAADTSAGDDLPDFDRTPTYDMFEPKAGPFNDPNYYPEDFVEYIAESILEDHKNGKLKTLAELYGEEADEMGTNDIQWGLLCPDGNIDQNQESNDSGLIMSGPYRNESEKCHETGRTKESDISGNGACMNCNDRQAFCSSVRGSQEPCRFSPGLSPIRCD